LAATVIGGNKISLPELYVSALALAVAV